MNKSQTEKLPIAFLLAEIFAVDYFFFKFYHSSVWKNWEKWGKVQEFWKVHKDLFFSRRDFVLILRAISMQGYYSLPCLKEWGNMTKKEPKFSSLAYTTKTRTKCVLGEILAKNRFLERKTRDAALVPAFFSKRMFSSHFPTVDCVLQRIKCGLLV